MQHPAFTTATPLLSHRRLPSQSISRRPPTCVSAPPPPAKLPPPPSLPEEVENGAALEAAIRSTRGLLVLEVFSRSCRPCLRIKRAFQKSAAEHAHHARFMLLSADKEPQLAQQLGVRAMPTFILFKNGRRIDHFASSSRETLEMYISDNV